MKTKPVIAIDIDDVLAANAAGFVEWSNTKFGTHLTPNDYHEHWAEIWKIEREKVEQRAREFYDSGPIGTYKAIPGALEVLRELKKYFTLILITSRGLSTEKITRNWIDTNYPNIFNDCVFCSFYDIHGVSGLRLTKAAHAQSINTEYLIDDQPKHIEAASEVGIKGLLFGDYSWNKKNQLPANVTRVKDWGDVLKYFNLTNKDYTGTIIEESLEDNRILNDVQVLSSRISKDDTLADRWHLYSVKVSKDDIQKFSKYIKSGKWYMHFWKDRSVIAVFKDKVFEFNYDDKTSWKDAVAYGHSLGIPDEQLDFVLEETQEEVPDSLKAKLIQEGFTHVYEWTDEPNTGYPEHAHKGKVSFYLTKGDIQMNIGGTKRTIQAGERIDVPVGVPHTAKVGPRGCTFVVGEEIKGDS